MSINDLTSAEILAIPVSSPQQLFAFAEEDARRAYRGLASQWHPDRCSDPNAAAVTAHLTKLHEEAKRQRSSGLWVHRNTATLSTNDRRLYKLRFRSEQDFEIGKAFHGDRVIGFAVPEEHRDLFDRGVARTRHFACADPHMAGEIERYLPRQAATLECPEWNCLIIHKTTDLLPLSKVLAMQDGRMDPRHVAWIISSLLNIACYLQYAGLGHQAIATDTVWVSPRDHYCALYGGWWYAGRIGEPMVAAPTRTMDYAPAHVVRMRTVDPRTDLELIRATGRELLGDIGGSRLHAMGHAPEALIEWLRLPSAGSAIDEYLTWTDQIIPDAFGGRRFTACDVRAEDVYAA